MTRPSRVATQPAPQPSSPASRQRPTSMAPVSRYGGRVGWVGQTRTGERTSAGRTGTPVDNRSRSGTARSVAVHAACSRACSATGAAARPRRDSTCRTERLGKIDASRGPCHRVGAAGQRISVGLRPTSLWAAVGRGLGPAQRAAIGVHARWSQRRVVPARRALPRPGGDARAVHRPGALGRALRRAVGADP